MTAVYVGAAMIAIAVVITVSVIVRPAHGARTVARSLALIGGDRYDANGRSEVDTLSLVDRLFELIAGAAQRLAPRSAIERLARSLDRAGRPAPWTIERLMGAKGVCSLLGVLLGAVLGKGFTMKGVLIAGALAVVLFHLPDLLIYNIALKRQEQIMRGFAEALDMLTICVEAGQGFDAALLEVARNVSGEISGELARMTAEVQIGTSRTDAFRALGTRVNATEMKNFVTAISQADKLGIPIATVLREQTTAMRTARRQHAEAQAQKVTVKILFPLMFCIFPALLVVVMGPAIIRMMSTFSHGM